jgi:glycosyltransferase involved in cell wall biosynthesis
MRQTAASVCTCARPLSKSAYTGSGLTTRPKRSLAEARTLRALRVVANLDAGVGGPAESAVNACIATQRAGIANTLVVLVQDESVTRTAGVRARLESEGVTLRTFRPRPRHSDHALRWAVSPRLAAWLGRFAGNYDFVHVHGAWGLSQLAGLLSGLANGRPCVMSPHEALTTFDISEHGPNRLRPAAKALMKRLYLRRLSLIVFSSLLEARDSIPETSRLPQAVIPHPLREALEVPRTEGVAHRSELRIGFLGRFHEKKNLHLLVRAVQSGTRKARLLIAGDGPGRFKADISALAQQIGMQERVEWLGFVEGPRKWEFLDGLDVLAMPSEYESFGMAAAEAMARGTPPVVSNQAGIADLVQRTGSGVVAAPTEASFAHALGTLESDPAALAALAAVGPSCAQAELSLYAYGRALRDAYEDLLRSG